MFFDFSRNDFSGYQKENKIGVQFDVIEVINFMLLDLIKEIGIMKVYFYCIGIK